MRGDQQAPAKVVFAEAHMPTLVGDDSAEHFRSDRIGRASMVTENRELQTLQDDVLREDRGLPIARIDELKQPLLEFQQTAIGALFDLGVSLVVAGIVLGVLTAMDRLAPETV